MSELSHQQARYLLQAGGPLGAETRANLQRHLSNCAECRAYAALLEEIRVQLPAHWPGPSPSDDDIRHITAQIGAQVKKKRKLKRVLNTTQTLAWVAVAVALIIGVGWLFKAVLPQPTSKLDGPPASTSETQAAPPTPTAPPEITPEATTPPRETEPDQERELTVCLGAEPDTLYLYGGSSLIVRHVQEALYDGPIDHNAFGYQAVILEKLPSLADGDGVIGGDGVVGGDGVIEAVAVTTGDRVLNDAGEPVTLEEGVRVRPAGCYDSGCALVFDGVPLEMEQMVVTFTLKPGILWSDGAPLTAYDSVYSFELDRNPDTPTTKSVVDRTTSYKAPDDLMAVWTGLPGYRDPEYALRFWTPLPAHAWSELTALELLEAQESSREPLGWGAYVVEEWLPGKHIALRKNENYWRADEGLPRFDTLIYRFVVQDTNANVAALLAGECDVVDQTGMQGNQIELLLELQSSGEINAAFATGIVWEYVTFGIEPAAGYERPDFFGDVRTRRAIAHCMDRQAVVDMLVYGQSVVLDTYLSPDHPLFNPGVQHYPFDPETGAALLEEVGWVDEDGDPATPRVARSVAGVLDGTPLTFNYSTTTSGQRQAVARVLQAWLAACGIKLNLEYWEPGEFFANDSEGPLFGRRFDVSQSAGLMAVTPPCNLFLCSEVPGEGNDWLGANPSGFCSQAYDAACEAALRSLPGMPGYEQHHREAQRIFAEQLPVVPLYARLKLAVARPDLTGFVMDPTADSEMWNIEAFDVSD